MQNQNIILALATALLSSLFTLIILFLVYKFLLQKKLEGKQEDIAEVLKGKLKEGVKEAGIELLPKFRDEVRKGFNEAMTDAVSGNLIDSSAKEVAKKGTNIMGKGLDILLGKSGNQDKDK